MDETKSIPYISRKRENDMDDSETIVCASPKRKTEDEIDEKIYKEPKLETAVEIEKQEVPVLASWQKKQDFNRFLHGFSAKNSTMKKKINKN